MADIKDIDRRALGILSDTVNSELGVRTLVAREVRRAYVSGRNIDLFSATRVFNKLPGRDRARIGKAADERAFRIVRQGVRDTERDWRDLAPKQPEQKRPRPQAANRQGTGRTADGRVMIDAPPSFLRPRNPPAS